jgi:hypothetical protein
VTLRAKGHIKREFVSTWFQSRYAYWNCERNADKLSASSSPYASDEHVSLIASRFDETAKRTFRSAEDTCLVHFGSLFDKDPANGIVNGKLKLSGYVLADISRILKC